MLAHDVRRDAPTLRTWWLGSVLVLRFAMPVIGYCTGPVTDANRQVQVPTQFWVASMEEIAGPSDGVAPGEALKQHLLVVLIQLNSGRKS
ncbi:hypothetical protein SB768_29730 [Burkholderia sp. SIMBA_043]|nr:MULTISPECIES: hypothetical protein [Burkholderia cepacia complex]MBR8036277.1 hypothetical protein [Burkholderia vietnamiensis]UBI28863.1 hypothetical protein LA325_26940 [Burkholderia vietnamiensis]